MQPSPTFPHLTIFLVISSWELLLVAFPSSTASSANSAGAASSPTARMSLFAPSLLVVVSSSPQLRVTPSLFSNPAVVASSSMELLLLFLRLLIKITIAIIQTEQDPFLPPSQLPSERPNPCRRSTMTNQESFIFLSVVCNR